MHCRKDAVAAAVQAEGQTAARSVLVLLPASAKEEKSSFVGARCICKVSASSSTPQTPLRLGQNGVTRPLQGDLLVPGILQKHHMIARQVLQLPILFLSRIFFKTELQTKL